MRCFFIIGLLCGIGWRALCAPALAELPPRVAYPYLGAIAVETDTGNVLFEINADAVGYPASVIKLLTLLTVLEAADSGRISLQDQVTVSARAAKMGGSQVYLREGETFTVDELLYALIVQSANDAAAALADHVAGGREPFLNQMRSIAQRFGMTNTVIHSEHGLPPDATQQPDLTTARDLALLCCALAQRPEVFRYTSTAEKALRETFVMRNHNPLLKTYPKCDGFKTGYFRKAGYSIAATACRDGTNRVAVVLLGCRDRELRNRLAAHFLNRAFEISEERRRAEEETQQPAPDSSTSP